MLYIVKRLDLRYITLSTTSFPKLTSSWAFPCQQGYLWMDDLHNMTRASLQLHRPWEGWKLLPHNIQLSLNLANFLCLVVVVKSLYPLVSSHLRICWILLDHQYLEFLLPYSIYAPSTSAVPGMKSLSVHSVENNWSKSCASHLICWSFNHTALPNLTMQAFLKECPTCRPNDGVFVIDTPFVVFCFSLPYNVFVASTTSSKFWGSKQYMRSTFFLWSVFATSFTSLPNYLTLVDM